MKKMTGKCPVHQRRLIVEEKSAWSKPGVVLAITMSLLSGIASFSGCSSDRPNGSVAKQAKQSPPARKEAGSQANGNAKDRILGAWANDSGQTFVFQDDGSMLWIFGSERGRDTFRLTYDFDPNSTPPRLDLHGFQSGPLKDQSLFGIVQLEGDRLQCDFEPGVDESVRPADFDPEETQVYWKVDTPTR